MILRFRSLLLLLICLAGIGLYRGWFSFSKPETAADGNKINISISVDKNKLKEDVGRAKQKVAEEYEQLAGKPSGQEAK